MAIQGYFPAVKPVAPSVGLLRSDGVTVVNHGRDADGWTIGPVDVELLAGGFDLWVTDYCSNNGETKIREASDVCRGAVYPFGIIAGYPLEGVINMTLPERESRARTAVDALSQTAIEHELWTGDLALDAGHLDAMYLTSESAVEVSPGGAATAADHALAALEWALGQSTTGQGVIHMTRDVAIRLSQHLYNRDGKIFTLLDTPVVVGSGYVSGSGGAPRGSAPGGPEAYPAIPAIGQAPTTSWMYATSPVTVHLGSIQVIGERRDPSTNEITTLAGRPAAVYWDPSVHFVAEVNLATAVG